MGGGGGGGGFGYGNRAMANAFGDWRIALRNFSIF